MPSQNGDRDETSPIAFIAFLDVLGFKDLVHSNSHQDLVRKYGNLIASGIEMSLSNGKYIVVEIGGIKKVIADVEAITVNSVIISDSLILWTKNSTVKSFIDIVVAVRNILVQGIYTGLPLRGSVAIGPITRFSTKLDGHMQNSVEAIVGKGLVHAYEAEVNQQWSGCVVMGQALEAYGRLLEASATPEAERPSIEDLINAGLITQYQVPMRDGVQNQMVVNWPLGNKNHPNAEVIRKSFTMHGKLADSDNVKHKIENTVAFSEAMRRFRN